MVVIEALRAGRVQDLERIDRYVLGTCPNVAHAMRRSLKRREDSMRRLSAELGSAVIAPWARLEGRRVEDCLGGLAPRDSRVLQLLFQEERTAAEVASALGTTAGNVRVIRHRAITRLRECVEGVVGSRPS